jgi:hypothetical protein
MWRSRSDKLNRQTIHLPSVAQLALAVLVISTLWSSALAMLGWGFAGLLSAGQTNTDPVMGFMVGVSLALLGFLMLPSAYYAMMRILGKPALNSRVLLSRLKPGIWIFALPFVIAVGYLVSKVESITWLFLPAMHVLAVGIPVAWMLYLTIRRLPVGSSQRMWGVFTSGMSLAPFLIMICELLAGLGFVLIFAIYLATQPEVINRLVELGAQLEGVVSEEVVFEILAPFLVNPIVIGMAVVFGAVVVPLIEEVLKPLGVWLLVGRKISPAAGFAAGALSGAGYGFFESLLLSNSTQDWTMLVIARIGTTSVHILTAALMGWALVQAWRGKKVLRLGMVYLCAVTIHGLWNGLTILFSFRALAESQGQPLNMPFIEAAGGIAPMGLSLQAAGCFVLLLLFNRELRHLRTASHAPIELETQK